ncbi:hypothetical protein MKW98_030366 [Papaver atlanticum]|uniref:Uncharacterized protein n=1 Tax=Papaver atlanticum TaxID=357466 RepID=A0AAD4TJ02_9MAGN|nr:hypothetical protein MKW98_030366 [Papaver atlanticum]
MLKSCLKGNLSPPANDTGNNVSEHQQYKKHRRTAAILLQHRKIGEVPTNCVDDLINVTNTEDCLNFS